MGALASVCNMHASAIKFALEDIAWVLALPHEADYSLPTYEVLIFGHMPSLLAMCTGSAGHEPHFLLSHWTDAVRFTPNATDLHLHNNKARRLGLST